MFASEFLCNVCGRMLPSKEYLVTFSDVFERKHKGLSPKLFGDLFYLTFCSRVCYHFKGVLKIPQTITWNRCSGMNVAREKNEKTAIKSILGCIQGYFTDETGNDYCKHGPLCLILITNRKYWLYGYGYLGAGIILSPCVYNRICDFEWHHVLVLFF